MEELIQKARITLLGIDDELKDDTNSVYTTVLNSTNFTPPAVDTTVVIDGVTFITKAPTFTGQRKNTKRMRFTLPNKMKTLNLTTRARLVIEAICMPNVMSQSFLQSKAVNNITLKLLNMPNNNIYDSTTKGRGGVTIFSSPILLNTQGFGVSSTAGINPDLISLSQRPRMNSDNNGNLYINTSPTRIYTFPISDDFLKNGFFEFELIYDIGNCWKTTATNNTYELIPQTLDYTNDKDDFEAFMISFIIMDVDDSKELVYSEKKLLNKINRLINIDKTIR
jgi:hypothetical protein